MKNWIRHKILRLIAHDIERIARLSYNDGVYVTEHRMRAEKQLELQQLVAYNEKLQEVMSDHLKVCAPHLVFDTAAVLKNKT